MLLVIYINNLNNFSINVNVDKIGISSRILVDARKLRFNKLNKSCLLGLGLSLVEIQFQD